MKREYPTGSARAKARSEKRKIKARAKRLLKHDERFHDLVRFEREQKSPAPNQGDGG